MLDGYRHLQAYFDAKTQRNLLTAVRKIIAASPLYSPTMPRTGRPFSVLMTNAGGLGWVSDKSGGYRYQPTHPITHTLWPPIPSILLDLWNDVGDWPTPPQACLINYYANGAKMGSHVDADEDAKNAPVVSVSLGDDAVFHVGGSKRSDKKTRTTVRSGDVIVLGNKARRAYHGIDRIVPGTSDLLDEGGRINLTLRRVTA